MTTYKLARWFAMHGHVVSVFSFETKGHVSQEFAELIVPEREGGPSRQENLRSLSTALETVKPDVVINQMPYEHDIGDVLVRAKSYLLIGCLRNSLFSVLKNIDSYAANIFPKVVVPVFRNFVGRRVLGHLHIRRHSADLRKILCTYDRFVMFGPPNLEELQEFVPDYDKEKVALIPNSVPDVLDGVPAKKKRILWLGRLDYQQKRADLILPVWENLAAILPDWHLDVVGDGPALQNLKFEAEESAIERIHFHGRREPDFYFRQASVFVMTSAFEGFPNVLVEAQSYACIPVIFDTFPIASWIINHGENGFLERPFDVKAMCNRIISIVESDSMGKLMLNSLANANRFNINTVGPQWISLFESHLGDFSERETTKNLD